MEIHRACYYKLFDFSRKIYQKDESVLFSKINISQNIWYYSFAYSRDLTMYAQRKFNRSKKKHSIGSKIRLVGRENREG